MSSTSRAAKFLGAEGKFTGHPRATALLRSETQLIFLDPPMYIPRWAHAWGRSFADNGGKIVQHRRDAHLFSRDLGAPRALSLSLDIDSPRATHPALAPVDPAEKQLRVSGVHRRQVDSISRGTLVFFSRISFSPSLYCTAAISLLPHRFH